MVSLRSRLVEAPVSTLKTSTIDHSAHESDDDQPRSANQPRSDEHSQLMTPAETDVPSLLDVALASSGAMEVAQGVGAGIDVDQGELNGPGIEETEEERDILRDMVEDGTANYENATNNTHQSIPPSGSIDAASSSIKLTEEDQPIRDQLHPSTDQASSNARPKRKITIDRIGTCRSLGMLSIHPITGHRTHILSSICNA